jgi:hypothetical protein
MVKIFKKIGRLFVFMNQRNMADMRQSVLLVDGNFILPNNFALILRDVKEKFKNAKIEVLTSKDKTEFLQDNFPGVGIITPASKIKIKRLCFYKQLLKLLGNRFDYIVLSSLDIIPVAACLLFGGSKVFLHNKWLEWYRLRFRTIGDILSRRSSSDKNRRNTNAGIKDILKSIGRKFVILQDIIDEDTKSRILMVDNGYTEIDYILTAVKKIGEIFVDPDVTVLTFANRRHYFMNGFAHTKVTVIGHSKKRSMLALVWQMCLLRKHKFGYIVLSALDALPTAVALELNAREVLLYNRWHQWWSLKFKNLKEYLKDITGIIFAIPIATYLLIVSGFILMRTFVRATFINLKNIPSR